MSTDLRQPHAFITVALKALKEAGQTEAAVLNNGLFLADLPEGIINADQLHEALPHPMHLIKVTLKGSDMSRLIREMEKKSSISAEISDSRDGLPRENFWRIML